MKKGRIIAGVATLAVLAALGGGYAFSSQAGKPTVNTARASVQDLSVSVSAPGTVDATSRTAVYSPVAGTLDDVRVSDGQTVKAGDVLATLDQASMRAAVAQADAQVAQADAQGQAAKAQLATARAQRAAALAMPHATSDQTSARSAALSAADAAEKSADAASSAASAARSAAVVVRTNAQNNARNATITAPTGGVVSFPVLTVLSLDGSGPKAAAGAAVTTAAPVFSIVDLSAVDFAAQVDEADIAGVTPDQKASVTLDAFPGHPFDGTVSQIATTSMSTKTGGTAFVVRVPLTPGDVSLRLGMSGNVTIATESVPGALVVPVQAVQSDGAAKYVYTITDGTAHRTRVEVGASTDTLAQITAGLAADDVVATTQLGSLTDGASVHVAG
ncbi:efflux RND transporter periplasmic adaptor subunit [Raineyella sp. LH-20]|uniref:efflux RND transporter periplasmic adaptor subunit n=1 Tax=Raineyella sp. LH-20 TaxID=3081204 RepID=UPI002954AB32|nr:efflux RND transporter periplasmic adaptor subunit [Raineyella sp. LH-20]WOP18519.1 efflux RND transporter periplasmic adaptor subunit [Raineyella sp. LH-20]